MSEIIQLTDTARLRIEQDQDASNPREDWDMLTGFVKIEGRGDSRRIDVAAVHSDPIGIADAHDRLDSARYQPDDRSSYGYIRREGWPEPEEVVQRWAHFFHGMHVEYDAEHGGYWFVDPAKLSESWPTGGYPDGKTKVEWEAEVIAQEQETYRRWAEGEVYGVILERGIHVETTVTHSDGTVTTDHDDDAWENVESLWGCYLDDDYTAQVVADQHFDLTDEETAALGLPERADQTG